MDCVEIDKNCHFAYNDLPNDGSCNDDDFIALLT